jgi:uncharacterized protein (TIRG00374 family)
VFGILEPPPSRSRLFDARPRIVVKCALAYQVYEEEGFAGILVTASTTRRLLLGALAAAALLALFFRGVDWNALGAALRSADRGRLIGVAAVTVVVYALRAWRWGALLQPLARVPFMRLLSATFVGFMTGLLIPRAGEVVRPYLVSRRYGVGLPAAFASIILERLLDVITVVFLFGLYLYLLPVPAAQSRGPFLGALKVGGALGGLAAAALILVLLAFHLHAERAMAVADRWLVHVPAGLGAPLGRALRSFGGGLGVLQAPWPHLLLLAGQSLLVWLGISLSIYWNNQAFGLDLPLHSAFLIVVFLTVGVAIPTPGMVGGFHEFYLLALTQAYGVEKSTAAAAGIACHALTNLPVLLVGLLFLGREGLSLAGAARLGGDADGGDQPPMTMASVPQAPAGRKT